MGCVPSGYTTVTVGDVDCNARTVPVVFDNTAVSREAYAFAPSAYHFAVWAYTVDGRQFSKAEGIEVGGRTIGVLHLRLPGSDPSETVQLVVINFNVSQTTLADELFALRLIRIDCGDSTARPAVVVGATLPQTGGFSLALPLLGVALVGTGGLLSLVGRRSRP